MRLVASTNVLHQESSLMHAKYLFFAGYPTECFNETTQKAKKMSLSIHLSAQQITSRIHEIFPKLYGRPFKMFTLDKKKNMQEIVEKDASSIWALNYQGVVKVKVKLRFSAPSAGIAEIEQT